MKLTNGEIFNAREPLERLMGEKLPVKASYRLAQLAAKLQEQLQVIEKVRQGLIQTYGAPDPENMRRLRVDPASDGYPKFSKELGELFSQEVEIVIEPVALPDTLEMDAATLMALVKFVTVA